MDLKTAKDLKIPEIGLGTWQMRGRQCINAVEAALNNGYRHVDTAEMYDNEDAVGAGIANAAIDRDDLFLTTKVWRTNLSPEDVHAAVEASLERLGTDHVDLLLVHWPNTNIPIQDTMQAFQEVKEEGKTRHIGVSNFTPALLDKALEHAPDLVCNQVEMHVYHQQRELVAYCQEHDLVLTAYSPLARGRVVDDPVLQEIGENHDATPAQIALAWLVNQENVAAIPKAVPEALQQENLAAAGIELTADEMDRLTDIEQRPKVVDPDFAPW